MALGASNVLLYFWYGESLATKAKQLLQELPHHRCRTLSRMLRAPQSDLTHLTLQNDMILKRELEYPKQSWLDGTVAILRESTIGGGDLKRLILFLSNRLQYVDFSDRQAVGAELDRLMHEKTWCNSVLHDEFDAWSTEVHQGATRSLYVTFVSERRDRGPHWSQSPDGQQ